MTVDVVSVRNCRRERIERNFIVTVLDEEHIYGTGHVGELRGRDDQGWFAKVYWDNGADPDWLHVDELTSVNIAVRERTLDENA